MHLNKFCSSNLQGCSTAFSLVGEHVWLLSNAVQVGGGKSGMASCSILCPSWRCSISSSGWRPQRSPYLRGCFPALLAARCSTRGFCSSITCQSLQPFCLPHSIQTRSRKKSAKSTLKCTDLQTRA